MLSKLVNGLFGYLSGISLDIMLYCAWGGFLAVFLLSLVLTVKVKRVKRALKGPFLCLLNAFTAVTLCMFLTENELAQSVLGTSMFWCVGYVLYGILCFCSKERAEKIAPPVKVEQPVRATVAQRSEMPPKTVKPQKEEKTEQTLNSGVRLDYALAVTENLLNKNLGKSDKMELEKLKITLNTLKARGTLTPAEGEILNDNFNALLKLMAKYDI